MIFYRLRVGLIILMVFLPRQVYIASTATAAKTQFPNMRMAHLANDDSIPKNGHVCYRALYI